MWPVFPGVPSVGGPTRQIEAETELGLFRVWVTVSGDSCSPLKVVYVHTNSQPAALSFPLSSSKTASGGGGVGRRTSEAATRSRTPAMDNTVNPNIHTIVKAQIVFLLSTLTEENFDRNQVEIRSVSLQS